MVTQNHPHVPEQNTRRERRLEYLQERRRVKKIMKKMRAVTFDNTTVTESANFQFIELFKELIGLDEIIGNGFVLEQKENSLYFARQLIDYLIDCSILGHTRFSHMNALKFDPGYLTVKEITRFPDESTFRTFLKKLEWKHLIQLISINKEILHRKARMEPKRLIWIDIDETVITLFGEQEGAVNGYNPRYHGRPSYKVRVAFIAGTGELLHMELNPGNTNGMNNFLSFVKEVEAMLPPEYIIEGIRADCGFADPAVMSYAEERGWEYVFKLPKKATVKKAIAYFQQHPDFWETLAEKEEKIRFATEDDYWAAADVPILLNNWEKARRCVIYRESHETVQTSKDQLTMMLTTYSFQAIITNSELKPWPLFHSYNQRSNIENRIDEIKEGYALEQNSMHSLMINQLFSWIKVIAYNVVVWFKQAFLPDSLQKCEVKTIRRVVIKVPGNVVGSGRYQHIRLAPSPVLKAIVTVIQERAWKFAKRIIPPIPEAA